MGGKISRGKLKLLRVEALARRELSISTYSEGSRECFRQPRSRSHGTATAPTPSHLQLLLPMHNCSYFCPFTLAAAPHQLNLQLLLPHTSSCSCHTSAAAYAPSHLQLLMPLHTCSSLSPFAAAYAPSHLQLRWPIHASSCSWLIMPAAVTIPQHLQLLLHLHTFRCSFTCSFS